MAILEDAAFQHHTVEIMVDEDGRPDPGRKTYRVLDDDCVSVKDTVAGEEELQLISRLSGHRPRSSMFEVSDPQPGILP
jgi:hypothetical protein